jgi:predicted dehydrogenase
MKTRVAVIGLGKMGLMHASIFSMLDGVELAAVCEKNGLIRRFGKKVIPNIAMVANLEELKDMRLDAVCVTTPPGSHFPIIKAVYEQHIAPNIFTEKPLASSYAQSQALCSMAETQGGVNMVGYHRRFSVVSLKAKQILDAGDIGAISSFKGQALSADFVGAKSPTQTIARGGVLEDSGCHAIDFALWLLGDMEVTKASVKAIIGEGSQDEAYLEVKTPGNLKGEFEFSWCREGYRLPDIGLSVTGSKGTLKVTEDMVSLTLNSGKSSIWYKHDLNDFVPFFLGGSEYQRQDAQFVKAIQQSLKVEPSFRTASRVEKLIDQANNYTRGLKV